MSPVDIVLGLTGVVVQCVQHQQDDIHVWARPGQRPPCLYCRQGPVRIKATYQCTLKHTRLMFVHLSVPKYYCLTCDRYFRHRFVGIVLLWCSGPKSNRHASWRVLLERQGYSHR